MCTARWWPSWVRLRGALGDILDRWIARVEDGLISAGADENAADFDEKVHNEIQLSLVSMTGGQAPEDFVRVIQTVFRLKQSGELAEAGALISWLSGSGNVAASAKKAAGIKGDIGSRTALEYLRGVLEIVKAAGYKGLLVVIDEAETILRMRSDSRHKSLNGIRQIADASGSYPGMLWMFTGTPEFYDTRHGVAGLAPLHDRIRFERNGRFTNARQPQLELVPFGAERLRSVAIKLREIFPTNDRARLERNVSMEFIDRLVQEVTKGFKGDVGVVPRQFLREFVSQLDLVEEHEDYVPMTEYGFTAQELSDEEKHALAGTTFDVDDGPDSDGENSLVPSEDVW
jgi:hypothetical protein